MSCNVCGMVQAYCLIFTSTADSCGGDAASKVSSTVSVMCSTLSGLANPDKPLLDSAVPEVTTAFSTLITDVSVADTDAESVLESFWCKDLSDFEGLKESSEI